mmetsp:Transcript_121596/g.355360  ORF Transcript_121596/g.355360 Transcript_121596/m.355360 type:complete len:204 (+) Transcript_121596:649-1260(+)
MHPPSASALQHCSAGAASCHLGILDGQGRPGKDKTWSTALPQLAQQHLKARHRLFYPVLGRHRLASAFIHAPPARSILPEEDLLLGFLLPVFPAHHGLADLVPQALLLDVPRHVLVRDDGPAAEVLEELHAVDAAAHGGEGPAAQLVHRAQRLGGVLEVGEGLARGPPAEAAEQLRGPAPGAAGGEAEAAEEGDEALLVGVIR